ncbi:hypothetical protein CCR75_005846 [Bremia lactucae]|uniref:Uncharacterized protein n=1 Tax=Bremia lactucae TaxID=4779 RepID=A0A976FGY1_BRELC|nr:hypothetical protein CCR75_005846 [Bremia lactucae]
MRQPRAYFRKFLLLLADKVMRGCKRHAYRRADNVGVTEQPGHRRMVAVLPSPPLFTALLEGRRGAESSHTKVFKLKETRRDYINSGACHHFNVKKQTVKCLV